MRWMTNSAPTGGQRYLLQCLAGLNFGQWSFVEGAQHDEGFGLEILACCSGFTPAGGEVPQDPLVLGFRLRTAGADGHAIPVHTLTSRPAGCVRIFRQSSSPVGILTTWMPASARTASNDAVNCPARSRTRKRKGVMRSPSSITRLRICWVVHRSSGVVVVPGRCTDLLGISRTKNT
jgi:hypothetical protein